MTIFFGTVRSMNDNACRKTCKMSKVHTRSHEITNTPCTSLYYRNTVTTDFKTNYNAENCASDVKIVKNRRKQNFEGEANNMQLNKEDTRRSKLNGRCVLNILILLFVFIMFNKLRLVKYDLILRYET